MRDTIRLTAGDFTQNALVTGANPVDIVGAGQGTSGTILRSPNSNFSLDIQAPGSTVSNLRVRVENQTGSFESGIFLSGAGVVANGVTVLGEPGVDNAVGVVVRTGAILRNSLVQVPLGNANQAIGAEDGARIENVAAAGDVMLDARNIGAPVVVRRLRSPTPSHTGIRALGAGSVDISDALIRLSGGSTGGGSDGRSNFSGHPHDRGSSRDRGRHWRCGKRRPWRLRRPLQRGTKPNRGRDRLHLPRLSTDSEVEAFSGSIARIDIGYSDYNPAKVIDTSAGDAAVVAGAGNLLANPGFVDGAAADFRLRADSPLIDGGFPGEGSTADLDGQPRPNDGDGDGAAVRDLGAFEYQRPSPPAPPVDSSAPLFRIVSKKLRLNRRGRVAVVLRGPSNETAASSASVGLRRKGRRLGRKGLSLRPSARTVVRVKLSRRSARRVRRAHRVGSNRPRLRGQRTHRAQADHPARLVQRRLATR